MNGHIGLGNKVGKEVATAIRGSSDLREIGIDPGPKGVLGWKTRSTPYCAHEGDRQVRIGLGQINPCSSRYGSGRFPGTQEDDAIRRCYGCLLMLIRSHQNQGELHEGYI